MTERDQFQIVGRSVGLRDGLAHVSGKTKYVADLRYPRMVHVRLVRSAVPHGRIKHVDLSEAAKVPGFVTALTHEDVPHNVYCISAGLGVAEDEYLLAEDRVRYVGEPIIAVVADTARAARHAATVVAIEIDELPAVFDVEDALKPDAPVLKPGGNAYRFEPFNHRRIRAGDVEAAFAESDCIIEGRYQLAPMEHAPTETQAAVVVPEADGRLTVHTNTQALFFTLDNLATILQLPTSRLRLVGGVVGGGFGGKVDAAVEPYAALAAMKTGRPAKYQFTRTEEMQASSTRGGWRMYFKDGVMKDGRLVARKVVSYHDSGAYNRLAPYAVTKHIGTLTGPYTIPNVHIDGYCVTTNRAPSSAMRGFGVVPASFGVEVQMDKLAHAIGMDPWRFRLINAYRNGDMRAYQKATGDAAAVETIQAAAELVGVTLSEDLQAMHSNDRKGGKRDG